MNQNQQLPAAGEEHTDTEKLKEVPAAPVVPNAVPGDNNIATVAPSDKIQEKGPVEGAGQQGVEPVGGAKVELVNNNNPVNVEKEEVIGLLNEKVVENLGVGPPNGVEKEGKEFGVVVEELGKGVEGGAPGMGVGEGVKQEVADKREVRGEEKEEVGEKAVDGGEDKVTGRELKALKGPG